MGRANQPHAQFNKQVLTQDFDGAMAVARRYELILDPRQALDLTILAGKARRAVYDPMAVKWIRVIDDRGKLTLREVAGLAQAFLALQRGNGAAARQLERFLERGRR